MSEVQKRWKKGRPPQSTTGVAKANSSAGSGREKDGPDKIPGNRIFQNIPAMAIANSGAVSTALTQNLLVMSRNSGFSSSDAVAVRGSSAMPQMGQEPGSDRTICGCMGQTYSRFAGSGNSGSRAMPQEGHAPGCFSRTSGHIGQT
jgi:hypothetical protein